MVKKHIIICGFLIWCTPLFSFRSLTELQQYAAMHTESPKSDDEFWVDPDFTAYHKSLIPNVVTRGLRAVGFLDNTIWDIKTFEQTLTSVLAQRKKANLSGRQVAHIQLSYPARVLVWGDIEGAFHSLVRSLTWLYQQGIMNNNFEVIKTDYYLVFNGNAINRSAYILETLTVLMILLQRNPDRVMYIRGNDEDHQNWHDQELKRELLIRTALRLTGKIPFEKPVSEFLDTLPLAFYISTIKDPYSVVRISPSDRSNAEINERLFGSFWTKPPKDTIHYYDLTKRVDATDKVTVKVIIKSEDWMIERRSVSGEPRSMFGLGLLNQDQGATAWSILSSPNMGNQKYLGFDYDAFGFLTIQSTIEQSSITLYNEKTSLLQGFKQHESFNLFTGIQLARKNVFKKDFKIGSTLALLNGLPVMSQRILRGMSARIQKANLEEELSTVRVTLTSYNDDYTPYIAYQNITHLLEKDHVDVVLLPTGNQTLASYLDLIRANKMLTLFPVAGSPQFFKPDLVGLINYRATVEDELQLLIDYVVNEKSVKKIALFYQEDAYGLSALEAAHKILKKKGITDWIDISYLRGSTEFKKQADILKEQNPDSIGLLSTALPTREFMRQIGTELLTNKVLFGPSLLGEESIRAYAKRQGLKILFSAVVPNPTISKTAIAQEYRKQMSIHSYKYDTFSFEAYIATSILIEALQKAKSPARADIKQYLESLKNYDFMGIPLSFDPQRRSLGTRVWIETDHNTEWFEKKISDIEKEEQQRNPPPPPPKTAPPPPAPKQPAPLPAQPKK